MVLMADEVYQQNVYQDDRPFVSTRKTVDELCKVSSIALSPNVTGQIMMDLMVKPPRAGQISYPLYAAESEAIMQSLRKTTHIMIDGFNACENIVCNFTEDEAWGRVRKSLRNFKSLGSLKSLVSL